MGSLTPLAQQPFRWLGCLLAASWPLTSFTYSAIAAAIARLGKSMLALMFRHSCDREIVLHQLFDRALRRSRQGGLDVLSGERLGEVNRNLHRRHHPGFGMPRFVDRKRASVRR